MIHCINQKAVLSKAAVLLLLIYCLMYFPLFVRVLCLYLFCYALLCVHSSFAIILKRKRKLVALLLLSCRCIVTINVTLTFYVLSLKHKTQSIQHKVPHGICAQ